MAANLMSSEKYIKAEKLEKIQSIFKNFKKEIDTISPERLSKNQQIILNTYIKTINEQYAMLETTLKSYLTIIIVK